MGIASLFFFKLFTYFWLHLGLQCHTDFLQLWQAETTRCRVRMGIASLFKKKKKKTRIYLFFAAFGSSVPSPSSLLLQSNQKRWPHSFSVFFFFPNLCSLSHIYLDFLFQHLHYLSPAQLRFCSHHSAPSAELYLGRELRVVHFKILETILFQH